MAEQWTVAELTASHFQSGRVEWIGCATERRGTMASHQSVELKPGTGIQNEHHANSGRSKRQITLIQAEHLPVIASLLGLEQVAPELLRRNIVVSGLNLLTLKKQRFFIGDVECEGTGLCAPCSRMEETFGPGGYNAVRGHGGITAIVHSEGTISIGDAIRPDSNAES